MKDNDFLWHTVEYPCKTINSHFILESLLFVVTLHQITRYLEMTLHIFNPEHDLALATNSGNFTAPNNVRSLRADLGFLPALWAKENDLILVHDIDYAQERLRHLKLNIPKTKFVDAEALGRMLREEEKECTSNHGITKIEPWGWDRALLNELQKNNIQGKLMPNKDNLLKIRDISSREWSALNLLPDIKSKLQDAGFTEVIGESFVVKQMTDLSELIKQYGRLVVKAPWSSSGRGIRYIIDEIDPSTAGWCKNMIMSQGCITVEPYYNKVKDFGMEFFVTSSGSVNYEGLSIFKTAKSMYEGSLLATEEYKRKLLAKDVNLDIVDSIRKTITHIMENKLKGIYTGPFGVDMMLVCTHPSEKLHIHPCVELNLRRTMGHVALSLTPSPLEPQKVMSITHNKQYSVRFHTVWDDIINNALV